ncbi:MAG: Peptidyl-tRNA hydrolase protein 2, mitochondrial [Marteilia pararefringens]
MTAEQIGHNIHKMALVIRSDLKMSKGKIASQCAHAAIGAFRTAKTNCNAALVHWNQCPTKVVLKCPNLEELRRLEASSAEIGVDSYLVEDDGSTEVPKGSITALAIGPALNKTIDSLVGHLKLL